MKIPKQITRRVVLILIMSAVLAAWIPTTANAESSGKTTRQPNVVFILVDDLGWSDLGVQGSEFYETPNIDRLAGNGVRFVNAYASSPVCSPTRAAILTGRHPARLHITNWIPGDDPQDRPLVGARNRTELPLEEFTLAEAMKVEGYATFFAGKWHLGGEGFSPENQGFDINVGGVHLGRPPGGYYSPYANPALADGPDGEFLTDRLTDEALSFIDANRDRPFFVYLSYYTVHTPLQGADRHMQKFADKLQAMDESDTPAQKAEHDGLTKQRQDNVEYASMIYALDENIGRIMDKIDDLAMAGNTHVIFTSDNGGRSTLYGPGDATANLPLRAGKGWLYEGGIRVPLIIKSAGTTGAGSVSEDLVVSTDFYPTILELVGGSLRNAQHIDGVSFVPILEGTGRGARNTAYFHYPHYHGSASIPSSAIRSGDWKLIQFHESEEVELYDLGRDIGETENLVTAEAERAQAMLTWLEQWKKDLGVGPAVPNPGYIEGAEQLQFRGLEPQ